MLATEKQSNQQPSQRDQEALLHQLSSIGVRSARDKHPESKLPSNISLLDSCFDGGLPLGGLVEWGAPLGRCGRDVALAYLAGLVASAAPIGTRAAQSGGAGFPSDYRHTRYPSDSRASGPGDAPNRMTGADWMLWVYGNPELTIYPPAWQARGVSLERMRFACTQTPVEDLRPVFLEPLFKIIVLDAPKRFSEDDCAFIARQARLHNQLVIVIRDFFLGVRSSNVWSRIRLNCWFDSVTQKYHLRVVRGLPPRHIVFSEQELLPAPISWQ